ncbi:helix-turn-helix domain-containing protein [Vibrio parahaemolyticus]|uniref:helix-turn-helix domain-containing protein n=1 Tax=Vibrio parahaemolyticus TaxID=670 RepID=UPI00215D0AD7|nr:helix-turn-helix transcriptional regulator [Vibrio parahaemolyticus]MCR9692910.1 helix-turn-helix domain-containing protein [Vibrio parahaemolyticus]
MADAERAERIKRSILSTGTYEKISEKTGIGVRTLVRIATGKSEPKFSDVIKISNVTLDSVEWLAYGDSIDQNEKSEKTFVVAADGTDEKTNKAHKYIIWNLRTLNKEDIQAIYRQVAALSSYRYTIRQQTEDIEKAALKQAVKDGNNAQKESITRSLVENYGIPKSEIDEIMSKANNET